MPAELLVFLVAASPIVELRGAIPLALKVYHLPVWSAYFFSVAGNLVPLLGIVFLGRPISDFLSVRLIWLKRFFDWLFAKVRSKTQRLNSLGKEATVLFLTALPVPFVGGWTGAIAAFLLEVAPARAGLAVTAGAMISGLIVTILTFIF